ncbi:hypothetical protein BFJ69_g3489 [Fusarium oxysporum]|uniref:Uncharacterized protein n=1 Tax=Fusarium oxysporum TaxID=5507 RepID=A0A420NNP2_FUSOX|nr:hypothetical protein BFJ69_g3489 [Fusarium oxysporum]
MTFAKCRHLRCLQTIDHDELADTKIGFIEMLPSTRPKRRGRPPKSSTLCGKLPGSKPRGRPRSTAPRIMSDKRIALTLGWRMRKFTMGKRSITDITNSLQSLHAQKQKELEVETNSLDEITASIQAKEASRTNHVNAKIDRLTSDVKAYESEREKILKIRGFVEQQHEGMMMKADHLLQQYTSRLEECDKLIAQANADVLEELDQMARRDFDLEDEEKRLEGRVKEVLEEVRHCSVVGTLMRLGPGGMAKLLGRLEGNGVELVGMAESIMNETEE